MLLIGFPGNMLDDHTRSSLRLRDARYDGGRSTFFWRKYFLNFETP